LGRRVKTAAWTKRGTGQLAERLMGTIARFPGGAWLMDFLQHEYIHILESLRRFELTPWKIVGLLGSVMFTSRWFVQLYYTRKLKRVVMPLSFWWLSVIGSALLLSYFIFGKNDSVGILSNFFPSFVSVYNLVVHMREVRRRSLIESEV
jgi:lipid-A-disaccharide synthase-like uncharacterized protein